VPQPSERRRRAVVSSSLLACLFAVLAAVPDASAAEKSGLGERLREVERELEAGRRQEEELRRKAEALDEEVQRLRADSVAAARAAQDHETRIAALEERLAGLDRTAADLAGELKARRDQFAGVLAALERMARFPAEALIAQPLTPSDTVRSAILLRAAVPLIEGRAQNLRSELAALADTRRAIAASKAELAAATGELEKERRRLDQLATRRDAVLGRTRAESEKAAARVAALAGEAHSLKELFERLEKERAERQRREEETRAAETRRRAEEEEKRRRAAPKEASPAPSRQAAVPPARPPAHATRPPTGRPISQARGTLPFPARGRIVSQYGQALETGLTQKGIVIEARSGAQVVAPYNGQVVFAGPFRGYGQLLIIEHGEGYHSLLAGMGRIDGLIGQWVVAGEPVGVMGRPDDGKPALYVEFRRNGQPINPLPWLASSNGKASG
jgi:septal ring factor EnvC (AmiA/AmiB activator)